MIQNLQAAHNFTNFSDGQNRNATLTSASSSSIFLTFFDILYKICNLQDVKLKLQSFYCKTKKRIPTGTPQYIEMTGSAAQLKIVS